ncbi:MAG: SpoIIE family protein phosphatase [Bacteroidetes bacterium]|nr:SpoIIE family protein phosphatase [Bacteroidota bacterium]
MEKMVIVCVDDEVTVLNSLREELRLGLGDRFTVEMADNAEDALQYLRETIKEDSQEVGIVISDHLMPGMKGDEFLTEVNKLNSRIRKILLTGQASAEAVGNALNHANLYRYMSKPWDSKDLQMTIEEAAKSYILDKELDARVTMLADLNICSQLLAEEVSLNSALEKIILLATTKTASSHGVLVLMDRDVLLKAVQATHDQGNVDLVHLEEAQLKETMPLYALTALHEDGEHIALGHAYRDDTWKQDPYVANGRTRALYAHRIEVSDTITGIIYLESKNKEHYTAIRLEFMDLFSRSACATLQNSSLYESLEAKVAQRTSELEEKNRNIMDSIEYAKRIQYSILPSRSQIAKHLPDHYVFYQAKDVVCGDFYWFNHKKGHIMLGAVDCTGHGVPGAFMTLMGYNLLNQIVMEQELTDPARILSQLDLSVREALHQEEYGGHDGMDVALVSIQQETGAMSFAGAYRPLLVIRNGELHELRGDRHPIGGSLIQHQEFTNHSFQLQKGDRVFMFSDGITDQLGGPDRRKLTPKRFYDVLQQSASLPLARQGEAIEKAFADWKMNLYENMDDIMVVAFEW